MFRVVIVGPGYIAQNHVAAVHAREDARVVAVVGRDQARAVKVLEAAGCPFFTELEDAVAQTQANVAIICLPTDLHEAFVIKAAKLKCHVLCEKPVTFDVASFDRMVWACEENGVRFMVGQVARWWPEFIAIKEHIRAGELGALHMISEKRICQHPTWATWHRDPARSGGGLYDLNVHDIDYLCDLFGQPERLYATGWQSDSGCWNHVCTSLTWPGGVKAVCETSLEMTGNWPFSIELRATGDKGTISYALTAGLNINDGERGSNLNWYPAGSEEVRSLNVDQVDMFIAQDGAFFDAVKAGAPMPVSHDQVRVVLKVIAATVKSLETGEVVKP